MYQPQFFREDRLNVQQDLIRAHPLGTLVTYGPDGLTANPLPFLLDAAVGEKGILKAHLARANPQWRTFNPAVEVLVIFQGPESYISPSWYPSKQETGKVVPTWNYATVHVYGTLRVIDDEAWLAEQVAALTHGQESKRENPWSVEDAPPDFIAAMLNAIIGIEIDILRIEGKWKISQNKSETDRFGIIDGLSTSNDADAQRLSAIMASQKL
jgi:transcriptional regulator